MLGINGLESILIQSEDLQSTQSVQSNPPTFNTLPDMSTSPGPEVPRTPRTNLLSSAMRAFSAMTSGTNRNLLSEDNVSVEEGPGANVSMAEDPDESATRRIQTEGISMIHRMQRVTDRLEREADNLLMNEFRTLEGASENVIAAKHFYDHLESNNGEEDLTSAESPLNQNFIGSG